MKGMLWIVCVAFLLIGQAFAEEQPKAKSTPMSQKEKLSYSLGYKTGRDLQKSSVNIDPDVFAEALREGFTGTKPAMTDQDMRNMLGSLQKEMKATQADEMKDQAEKNKREGEAFLAENALKKGVVTLPSGLQYKIVKEGTGRQPAKSDKVTVHYRGTLLGGAEFYDSSKKDKPVTNDVDKFIKGMAEALHIMKEGSKWMLFVPSNLAYGERGLSRGTGAKKTVIIGPNQTLIFEVELITVYSPTSKEGFK